MLLQRARSYIQLINMKTNTGEIITGAWTTPALYLVKRKQRLNITKWIFLLFLWIKKNACVSDWTTHEMKGTFIYWNQMETSGRYATEHTDLLINFKISCEHPHLNGEQTGKN